VYVKIIASCKGRTFFETQCSAVDWGGGISVVHRGTSHMPHFLDQCQTRNVGQCPTWWPPCRI